MNERETRIRFHGGLDSFQGKGRVEERLLTFNMGASSRRIG